jgi:hypothetical protein
MAFWNWEWATATKIQIVWGRSCVASKAAVVGVVTTIVVLINTRRHQRQLLKTRTIVYLAIILSEVKSRHITTAARRARTKTVESGLSEEIALSAWANSKPAQREKTACCTPAVEVAMTVMALLEKGMVTVLSTLNVCLVYFVESRVLNLLDVNPGTQKQCAVTLTSLNQGGSWNLKKVQQF